MDEINQIKNFANQTLVPIVKDDGLSFILDYIKENNVKLILEIGTAIGYSSIKFAQVNPDVRVYTIEFDIDRYQQAVKNVNDCNLGEQITVFLGDAMAFDFDDKFDMIFIDGPKAQYINFFEKFKKIFISCFLLSVSELFRTAEFCASGTGIDFQFFVPVPAHIAKTHLTGSKPVHIYRIFKINMFFFIV